MKEIKFPINLNEYKKISLNLSNKSLTKQEKKVIVNNIKIARDSIIFLTAYANVKGLSGHTGGAYDIVPEAVILDCMMRNKKNNLYPVLFDEAGHRVALQYLFAAINGHISSEKLLYYRDFNKGLYGHPEKDEKKGIFFSSGRLGHLWSYVNGVSQANPTKRFIILGSDGSQQEGNDAEAARYAVANNLKITLLIDDNDVTISGHPSEYMKGYDVGKTLQGHGIKIHKLNPENIDKLYFTIRRAILSEKPSALINKRKMMPGIKDLENSPKGHEAISLNLAIEYLKNSNQLKAIDFFKTAKKINENKKYLGSTLEKYSTRDEFGNCINKIIKTNQVKKQNLLVIDNDLEGSTGLKHIHSENPDYYQMAGIMERNNFSVAAGFGSEKGKQAIYSTFSAFTEMIISEITMARLNHANVIAHFSHSGIDEIADNTCHFGINNIFVDNGIIENDNTMLYYPADINQLNSILQTIFNHKGIRFVFTTRSKIPKILNEDNKDFFNSDYTFKPGFDEIICNGKSAFIVTYGEMLYRCLDAVESLKKQGYNVGLINKPTLNIMDLDMMKTLSKAKLVLFVESQNYKTGLGSKFGTWLLETGFKGQYQHLGVTKLGKGGLWEQIYHQSLDSESIMLKFKSLYEKKF